ncbi:MAG: glycosyltransferase [Terriglobia bacterium]
MKFFFIPAVFLLLESLWSLRGGFRFLDLVRRARHAPPGDYCPRAAVIVPCKGLDDDLRRNAAHFLRQDYPAYQLVFVVASPDDPAYRFLADLVASSQQGCERAPTANVIIAGQAPGNGEKVNNLLAGVSAVGAEAETLVFADIDIQPPADWLRALVAPLANPSVTVSTGFRWYLPGASFASRFRAAWDTAIASMFGDHDQNFAWGGSMAIRVDDFRRLRVAERYWQQTVSDDYALTRAVRDAGGAIHFASRCLMASRGEMSWREFTDWSNRQIVITRVYASDYWKKGLAFYSLYAITFVWGLALIFWPGGPGLIRIIAAALLAAIIAAGTAKGAIRARVAREIFPSEQALLQRYGSCYWKLAPLLPWVMLWNFCVAIFRRKIEWAGTVYQLRSARELKILRRGEPSASYELPSRGL